MKTLKNAVICFSIFAVLLVAGRILKHEREYVPPTSTQVYEQVAPSNKSISECDPAYVFKAGIKPGHYVPDGESPKFEDVKLDPRATGECERNPDRDEKKSQVGNGNHIDLNPNRTYTCSKEVNETWCTNK